MLFRKYCKMSISVNQRSIGSQGLKASTLGYGAMGLTAFYGPPSEDENSIGSFCIHLGIKTVFKTKNKSNMPLIKDSSIEISFRQLLSNDALSEELTLLIQQRSIAANLPKKDGKQMNPLLVAPFKQLEETRS